MIRRALLVAALALPACGGEDPAPAKAPPPAPAPPNAAGTAAAPPPRKPFAVRFTDLHVEATGFGPVNHTGIPGDKQWIAEAMGGGAILLDHDGDGDQDVLFVDGNVVARPKDPDARTRLFRNEGGFRFTEVTREAGIDITEVGYGGAAADYDGDGDVDAFVGVLGRNRLLRNDGDGTFTDVAAAAGVQGGEREMSTAACWADFDGDGRLDLYVSNYIDMMKVVDEFRAVNRPGRSCDWRGFPVYCGPKMLPFQRDRLFLQRPDGTFADATDALRGQVARPTFQAVAADFDGDGDQDVFAANDTEPHHLWINDGKASFTDEGMIAGCAVNANVNTQAGMGVAVSDYDHDGLLDLTVTNFSHDYNTIFRNQSRPRASGGARPAFEDVTVRTGVNLPTFVALCWSAAFADVDGDGDRDLFYSAGHVYGEIDNFAASGTTYRQRNLLLENLGGTSPIFADVRDEAGPGFRVEEVHRGGGMADLDDDGDPDFVVAVLNGKAYLLRNEGGNANAWIRISLRGDGKRSPRDPAGALVRVEADGLLPQTEVLHHGDSFCSSSDPRLLFGLGAAAKAALVRVTWPSGARSEFRGLDARAHWLLEEGVAEAKRLPR